MEQSYREWVYDNAFAAIKRMPEVLYEDLRAGKIYVSEDIWKIVDNAMAQLKGHHLPKHQNKNCEYKLTLLNLDKIITLDQFAEPSKEELQEKYKDMIEEHLECLIGIEEGPEN